jgi:hypothetical protein
MSRIVLCVVVGLIATPAFAQSTYVGAAVGMDVSRFNRVEASGFDDITAGGEVLAVSLRLGTEIRDNWGVELGFTYPSALERESSQGFPIPLLAAVTTAAGGGVSGSIGSIPVPGGNALTFPAFQASTRIERRNTTLDALAWVARSAGDNVDLVFLGGVGFNRITEEVSFQFTRPIGIIFPNSTRTISYDVGPVVGVEGRIELTENARLVPGLRLQSLGGNGREGWLLRPSVGLAWQF